MIDTPHVVAVCGSLRDESTTRTALAPVLAAAEDEGATTELLDLGTLELPLYDADDRDAGDAPELRRRIRRADAVVLGSPIYHGTVASPLKTALDYCGFDEFEDTLVGVVVTAGGRFPTPAILHLRTIARWVRAWTHPTHVGIPNASDHVDPRAGTVEEEYRTRLESLGADVARYAAVGQLPDLVEGGIESEADAVTGD